ncbi:hypothetical protein RCL_jg15258.t1 [Rhizophagus clarus]|nr:hypothetical protein RCL_jg15258.t1 [Rhizophagus clarus]
MEKQEKSKINNKSWQEVNMDLKFFRTKPIGFFHLTQLTSRARAIKNFRKRFDLAINRSEGDNSTLAYRTNHDTDLRIQQDFTSTMANIVSIAGEIKSDDNKENVFDIEKHSNRKHQLDDVLDNEIPVDSVPSVTKKVKSEDNDVKEKHEAIYIRSVHLAHKVYPFFYV